MDQSIGSETETWGTLKFTGLHLDIRSCQLIQCERIEKYDSRSLRGFPRISFNFPKILDDSL